MKAWRKELRPFTLWVGFGLPPLLAGALAMAYAQSLWLGAVSTAVFLAWFYESGRTTCARCAYYGTAKCGLPGLLAPLFTERKPASTLTSERIRSHLHLDLWVMALINGLYVLNPWLLPLSLGWTIGAWRISFGPKRHHGLLVRLREQPAQPTVAVVRIERSRVKQTAQGASFAPARPRTTSRKTRRMAP